MKNKKFNYFPNHGDDNGKCNWTICYGQIDDYEHIIIGVENTKKDAIEACRRLNGIFKLSYSDKEEIKGEFTKAVRALKRLDESGESINATTIYEALEFFRDKCLNKIYK